MRLEPATGDAFTLRPARVHEATGRGRRAFALFQAARHPGPLIWVLPSHVPEMPMLLGLPGGVSERLHLLRPVGETDQRHQVFPDAALSTQELRRRTLHGQSSPRWSEIMPNTISGCCK